MSCSSFSDVLVFSWLVAGWEPGGELRAVALGAGAARRGAVLPARLQRAPCARAAPRRGSGDSPGHPPGMLRGTRRSGAGGRARSREISPAHGGVTGLVPGPAPQ